MTKYNLNEFKAWLEEKPENTGQRTLEEWKRHTEDTFLVNQEKAFDYFVEGKDYENRSRCQFASNSAWKPYHKVVQKWLAEREREQRRYPLIW